MRALKHFALLVAPVLAIQCQASTLEGVVLENRSTRPLARTQVVLHVLDQSYMSRNNAAMTDSAGRFSFRGLAPGVYMVSASRAGYADANYGQKRWSGSGSPIVLQSDGKFFCEIRLKRLGAVSGEVLDENQVGLPGNTVVAYPADREPRVAGSASSDDRGVFRISGLPPGRYYIRTSPQVLVDSRSLAPTYYGQTSRKADASIVEVALDAETTGVRVEPLTGRLGRLSGFVTGGAAAVTLYSDTGKQQISVPADGRFTFESLAPGDYEILAVGTTNPQLAAYRKLLLTEGAQETTLTLAPWPVVHVSIEEADGGAIDPHTVLLSLRLKGRSDLPVPRLRGGDFTSVPPGEYSSSGLGMDYYVQSIRSSQASQAPGEFVALPGEQVEIAMRISRHPASLKGKTLAGGDTPAVGAPVFLNALDPELRKRIGGAQATRTTEDGVYSFRGLPPGQYQVVSSFEYMSADEIDWQSISKTVALEERQEAELDLELSGGL